MSNAKKCDICGELFESKDASIIFNGEEYKNSWITIHGINDYATIKRNMDLCPNHYNMLEQLLDNQPKIIKPDYVEQAF